MGSAREFPVEHTARTPSGCAIRPRAPGFTLIELLIAMVVLAILATIAYPTYTEFVMRSRIIDATSQLNDYRTRMEQAFQDNRRYDNPAGICAVTAQIPALDPARDNFGFACTFTAGALGGYSLDATGNAAKGMSGFTYRLATDPTTGALTRSTPGVAPGWSVPAPNTCWAVRKNGYCS